MNGILARGSTDEIKYLLFSVFEQCKVTSDDVEGDTLKETWKILKWSLDALFDGKFPDKDWKGDPWPQNSAEAAIAGDDLAEGMFACIYVLKGDMEHFSKNYGVADYRSNKPCPFCPADRYDDVSKQFTNFRPDAGWKTMVYILFTWLASLIRKHELFNIPYLSILNVGPDELHVLHLGVTQYFLASLLYLLTYHILVGTAMANLARIWNLIVEFYQKKRWLAKSAVSD